jgi:hypothetical protein
LAKPPASTPSDREVAQVQPTELHATSDIRFVMWEVGKLTTAVDGLTKAIDKLGDRVDKQSEKISDLKEKVAFTKGALWVIGIIGVIVVPLLTWLLNHSFPPPVSPPPTAIETKKS